MKHRGPFRNYLCGVILGFLLSGGIGWAQVPVFNEELKNEVNELVRKVLVLSEVGKYKDAIPYARLCIYQLQTEPRIFLSNLHLSLLPSP